MKIIALLFLFVNISFLGISQTPKTKSIDTFAIISLRERQNSIESKVDQLSKEISKLETTTTESIRTTRDDFKFLLNVYLSIALGAIGLIAFFTNLFGKNAIRKWVGEIIKDTAQKQTEVKITETLNSTLTNELLEEIIKKKSHEELNRILKNIESQGSHVIEEFKTKGDEILKSMLASPPVINEDTNSKNLNKIQLTEQTTDTEANALFNLAFNSTDSRLQISLYKNVLELQPNNVSALNNLGAAYNNLKETENAIEVLTKAIEFDNKYYLAYSNRGNSYFMEDKWEAGLSDLSIAISLNPPFYYPYSIKSLIYKKQQNFTAAEEALKDAIKADPQSAEAHFMLGFYYEETKKFDASLEFYEKAHQLNFLNPAMLFNNMAVLFRRQKNFDKALEYIEKARQENPSFPNLDGTMALIYADKNDDENFYKYLTHALEKGCQVWNYLEDDGFTKYRDSKRLNMLITPYKQKYFA